MKSLCITGASSNACEAIAAILYRAGLVPAKAAQHSRLVDMRTWHERAVPLLTAEQPLGRLWDRAAEELLLANLSEQAWGWHEAESIWALGYWANLDPGIHFLLLCEAPEQMLAKALLGDEEAPDLEGELELWRARHGRMLDFYLDHPDRCLLVDASQAQACPAALIAGINERWQLLPSGNASTASAVEQVTDSPAFELARAIATAYCEQQLARIGSFRQELEAAQLPLDSATGGQAAQTEQKLPIASLRLFERLLEQGPLLESERQIRALAEAEAARLKSELEQRTAAIDSLLAEKSSLSEQLSAAQQECESLLLRLHDVQEQLEKAIAERQADSTAFATEREKLKEELERFQALAAPADVEANYQLLREECEQLLIKLSDAQDRLEESLTQRQADRVTFQAERNKLATALEKAQEQLAQAIAQHQGEKAAFTREQDELRASLEASRQQAEAESERLRRECESLLLALDRAQDRLEESLQRHQQQKKELGSLTQRLHALKRRAGPLFAADDTITLKPTPRRREWQFERLLLGNAEYEKLTVALEHHGKQAALTLEIDEKPAWSVDSERRPSVHSLPESDRELLAELLPLLEVLLSQEKIPHKEMRKWRKAIADLQEVLNEQPPQLTFESAELRHAQINPDYEHLWFTLKQARFGEFQASDWHFRISCASVRPGSFGQEPKLELPQQERQLLKGWFEESRDDFGAKLELRFALPEAVDLEVWRRLPHHDQLLVQSLLLQLPTMMGNLELESVFLGRPREEWVALAVNMRRILQAQAT